MVLVVLLEFPFDSGGLLEGGFGFWVLLGGGGGGIIVLLMMSNYFMGWFLRE